MINDYECAISKGTTISHFYFIIKDGADFETEYSIEYKDKKIILHRQSLKDSIVSKRFVEKMLKKLNYKEKYGNK